MEIYTSINNNEHTNSSSSKVCNNINKANPCTQIYSIKEILAHKDVNKNDNRKNIIFKTADLTNFQIMEYSNYPSMTLTRI